MGNTNTTSSPTPTSNVLIKGIVRNDNDLVQKALYYGANPNEIVSGIPVCFYLLTAIYKDNYDFSIIETLKWYGMYFHQPSVLKSDHYFTIKDRDYDFVKTSKKVTLCKVPKGLELHEFLLSMLTERENQHINMQIYQLLNSLNVNTNAEQEQEQEQEQEVVMGKSLDVVVPPEPSEPPASPLYPPVTGLTFPL